MKNLILLFIALPVLIPNTQAQEPFLIDTVSTVTCEQYVPAVATDGNDYIVMWGDSRNSINQIHGAIINESGTVLNKIEVSAYQDRGYPSLAFDGDNYMVVYTHIFGGGIFALRYNKNGFLINPNEQVIFNYDRDTPKICFGQTNFLLAYNYSEGSRYYPQVNGIILYPNGSTGSGFGIEPETRIGNVSFDGKNFLVVYDYSPDYWPPPPMGIYGLRVDTLGAVIDTSWIQISPAGEVPSSAFDGVNYLVVWQEKDSADNYDIYATQVSTSGEVLDTLGFPISTADSNQVNPDITFNGENYIVVWEDYRNGHEADIYGAEVDTKGNVTESFPISTQDGDQMQPALVKGSDNNFLVVYSGWTGEYQGTTYNSMRIWGKMLGEPNNVDEDKNNFVVKNFKLEQNFPNPFNPSTSIKYQISELSFVTLKVYDVLGNEIITLVNGEKPVGTYEIEFNSHSGEVRNLTSGVYFYKLKAGSYVDTKKMILLK